MASAREQSGPLTDLAHQASRKGGEVAHWLQDREPADVLESVRSYGRRHPVTFLALCGLAGVVAGRLTRSAVAYQHQPGHQGRRLRRRPVAATHAPRRPCRSRPPVMRSGDRAGPTVPTGVYGGSVESTAPADSVRRTPSADVGPGSRLVHVPTRTVDRSDDLRPPRARHCTVRPSVAEAAREGYAAPRSPLQADDGRSIGSVLGDITANISTLLQQEVALAKAELRQSGSQAGKGIGLFAGAGVGGLLLLVFVSLSAMWGLAQYIDLEWSALIVAAVWAIIAAILFFAGKAELKRVRGLPATTETLSKVPPALKGHEEENR